MRTRHYGEVSRAVGSYGNLPIQPRGGALRELLLYGVLKKFARDVRLSDFSTTSLGIAANYVLTTLLL
jgi:hypothetical protein